AMVSSYFTNPTPYYSAGHTVKGESGNGTECTYVNHTGTTQTLTYVGDPTAAPTSDDVNASYWQIVVCYADWFPSGPAPWDGYFQCRLPVLQKITSANGGAGTFGVPDGAFAFAYEYGDFLEIEAPA